VCTTPGVPHPRRGEHLLLQYGFVRAPGHPLHQEAQEHVRRRRVLEARARRELERRLRQRLEELLVRPAREITTQPDEVLEAGRVREQVVDGDGPRVGAGELGDVVGDPTVEAQFALLHELEHDERREGLGQRRELEAGLRAHGHPGLHVRVAEVAPVEHAPAARDEHAAIEPQARQLLVDGGDRRGGHCLGARGRGPQAGAKQGEGDGAGERRSGAAHRAGTGDGLRRTTPGDPVALPLLRTGPANVSATERKHGGRANAWRVKAQPSTGRHFRTVSRTRWTCSASARTRGC
jgi:hypothetical protein